MKAMGIYIHIPFCTKKCEYCDFISYDKKEDKIDEYVECLIQEIQSVGIKNKQDAEEGKDELLEIQTIYIGGGTPSFLQEEKIEKIMQAVKENYTLAETCEITIEVNPGTVTKEKLTQYIQSGVNRISIGLQSVQEHVLTTIGRVHSYEVFEETYKMARECGFQNINIDLMIGLPKQNLSDVQKSIEQVVNLNPEHISVYSLILEQGTNLEKRVNEGELELPKEEVERKEYWAVKKMLEEAGFVHYEISNFAKPGKESKHNLDCWEQKEYLGFGVAAHSYTDKIRYSNIESVDIYIKNIKENKPENNFIFHEKQDEEAQKKEYMLLGLRKIRRSSDFKI